jgi:glycosyltransferase involved in cell wall biosynthesis
MASIAMMRILLVHNKYRERGGEDVVFESEERLLKQNNQSVNRIVFDNKDIPDRRSLLASTRLIGSTIWSSEGAARVRSMVREFRPDIVHFHNTFPLISPAAYSACKAEGVAVVQTLHNYRLLCPNSYFFRDGHACEDCVGHTPPWPGVIHACYRGSRPQSAVVAAMLTTHRLRRTWQRDVDLYIALTEFAQQRFISGGLPAEKITVKPNFVSTDPGVGEHGGGYALFVGRLSEEKGVRTLLQAWERLGGRLALKIAGDGPLADEVAWAAKRGIGVEWLGRQTKEQVTALMQNAQTLILPSLWYEAFALVIVEAYSVGLPVIASNLGSMSSLIQHGRTGLHFSPGDPEDLAAKVEWTETYPEVVAEMGREARREYEAKYTAEQNYQTLLRIYEQAIQHAEERG